MRDVTAQKVVERALRDSEEREECGWNEHPDEVTRVDGEGEEEEEGGREQVAQWPDDR